MNGLRQRFHELVPGAISIRHNHLLSAWRMKQFENTLKQFETELIQGPASNDSKSLRVLANGRAEIRFGFEYRRLGATECFTGNQIVDDLLGDQLPID
jgi:hypothetical protein